jgi:prepilin-type N-terminal cleavage/methylation domain-containing protein
MTLRNTGFTIIEAIVALVILSVTFSAIWGWFDIASKSTERLDQAIGLPFVVDEFIRQIELEDLRRQKAGNIVIGEYVVEWQSKLDKRSDNASFRKQYAWIVALFKIDAVVFYEGKVAHEITTYSVRQWKDPDFIDLDVFER